jgi:hypothetical protein
MSTFEKTITLAALWAAASVAHASDELVLRGTAKEKLSGTVTGIEESGVIVLASPLSDEPLRLQPNTVARVVFGGQGVGKSQASMLVELTNGDRLPVDLTSYTAQTGMRVSSPAIGDLVIPSAALSSLELGVPERRLVFEGPGDTAAWSNPRDSAFDKVSVEAKDWSINGRLEASRQIEMPENFVLRFLLGWEQRQQPNIKIYFASPEINSMEKADRYFLQFNNAGFEIKRESTKDKRFPSVLISNRRPEEFAGRQVEVEIHVNRMTKRIDLFLNGQMESWGLDPCPAAPDGAGIILGINGMEGTTHTLRGLTVHELDNTRVRHRAEDRGNPDMDSLLSRDESRWSGELREIRRNDGKLEFVFLTKTVQSQEPLEIPQEDVSTVFFRKQADKARDASTEYRLHLRGEGILSARSCRISDEKITVNHPLLGELHLPKQAILRIEPTEKPSNIGDTSE